MKVQDRPSTIYVRDIDEETSERFAGLKRLYASNSNTETVKRLINDFHGKERELRECKELIREQRERIESMRSLIMDFQRSRRELMEFRL